MEIIDWIERIGLILGGVFGMQFFDFLKSRSDRKGELDQKRTVDETRLAEVLLDHNQSRYDALLSELTVLREESRDHVQKIEKLTEQVIDLRLENLHLRHLLGISPNDPPPATIADLNEYLAGRECKTLDNYEQYSD